MDVLQPGVNYKRLKATRVSEVPSPDNFMGYYQPMLRGYCILGLMKCDNIREHVK